MKKYIKTFCEQVNNDKKTEIENLEKELSQLEAKYSEAKNVEKQNEINKEMTSLINKIMKLKNISNH